PLGGLGRGGPSGRRGGRAGARDPVGSLPGTGGSRLMGRDPGPRAPATSSHGTGARFSADRLYRYSLWRVWDADRGLCNFLMLNPSTADEAADDPTVARGGRNSGATAAW